MRGKWSLNALIPTLVLGIGATLFSVYLVGSWFYQKAQYRQVSQERLTLVSHHLGDITQRMLLANDSQVLETEFQSLYQLTDIEQILVVDSSNTVLHAGDDSLEGQALTATELASAVPLIDRMPSEGEWLSGQIDDQQKLTGIFPVALPDESAAGSTATSGHIVVRLDLSEAHASMLANVRSQWLMAALLLASVAGVSWYVLHRFFAVPLRRILTTTRAFVAGDYTVRSRLASSNELGEISATLDSLAVSYLERAELQNEHERLSCLVQDMVDEFYVNDAETLEVIASNKSAQTNLGYSAEELTGMGPWDFVQHHTKDSFNAALASLVSGEVSHRECESVHVRKDGSTYPCRSRMQYMPNQSPPVLLTISQDLSELKVQQEQSLLRERAIDAVSEGVIITDAGKDKRIIVYANPAISELTGYDEEELLGSDINMLRKNDLDQPGLTAIRNALMGGESVQVQLKATRKDGSAYVADVSMSPVFNASGELTHYIGIHRDVTQKLETEEKLHRAQKIKAIGHLSGGLAHDFNNLLSVIVGNLELLRVSTRDESQMARIEGAENAAHMGAHLTRRLLSFASQQRLAPVVTNLNDHIRNALALLAPTIGETITLTEELTPNLWDTLSDPGEIETAVINLTINARDAMPQGGTIIIRSSNVDLDANGTNVQLDVAPGQYVRLCVMDNGPGISESLKGRIFEPFVSTKADNEGSGLGLASVYGFARQSGGCVNVCSTEGKGTTFSVYLPRHVQVEDASRAVASHVEKPGLYFDGLKILVVEDKDMVRQLTVQQLKALGFATLEAENGVEAIALLERGTHVDVVLSDVVMPGGVCGYDVAEWVRTHREHCHILLTSGFNAPTDHRGTMAAAGLHVLQKPYRLEDLRKTLQEVMSCQPASRTESKARVLVQVGD